MNVYGIARQVCIIASEWAHSHLLTMLDLLITLLKLKSLIIACGQKF